MPSDYVQNTKAKCTNQRNLLYGYVHGIELSAEGAVVDSENAGGLALIPIDRL